MKKLYIILPILLIILIYLIFMITKNANSEETKFLGTVTKVDFGCILGGSCSVTVDGVEVNIGGSKGEEGSWGTHNLDVYKDENYYIGKKAEVFGKKSGSQVTLQGNAQYYLTIR